jgi:uncharacterized membrane protein YdcZ (DUF606 family)
MKSIVSFAPALLGAMVVFQAGLNRKIAAQWSFPSAVLLNSLVLFSAATTLCTLIVLKPEWFPSVLKFQVDLKSFAPWFVLPGLIGLCLVFGAPWAIARWGAIHTFVLLMSAQLATSIFWDIKIEGIGVSKEKLVGVALTWIGVFLACRPATLK